MLLVSQTRFMKMCLLQNGLSTLGLVVTHLQTEAASFRKVLNIVTVGNYSKIPCQCIIDSLQVKPLSISHKLQ